MRMGKGIPERNRKDWVGTKTGYIPQSSSLEYTPLKSIKISYPKRFRNQPARVAR
jgi:hypothetical protein